MKNNKIKSILALTVAAAFSLTSLTGCASSQNASSATGAGTLLLSVNPEIEIEYDKNGMVLELEGLNDDGKSVLESFRGFKGKACREVVSELVEDIYEAGYFETTVDGHNKNVVLKLEEGSSYPDEMFLNDLASGVRQALTDCSFAAEAVTVDEDDLDEQGYIGLEKAKSIVLAQLGLDSASFNDHEYDLDDGVYEFEFSANGVEYEYEVDARTGKVLSAEVETNDDWDDRDDWDDWNEFDDDTDDNDDDADDGDDDIDDTTDKKDDDDDNGDDDDDDTDDNN